VGTAALQLARVSGATVVGTSRSPQKLERAKEVGLEIGIDASRDDWISQVEKAIGVDRVQAVLDLVGAPYLDANLRLLALRGRMVVVGLTAGAQAHLNMGLLLRKRATIVGTVLRARPLEEKIALAREFSERIVPLFDAGRLKPVIDRVFPFKEIRAAHELMESNDTFGKVVLRWE
jgi:NADPH:quinone reductase-like Zn-dependent oxidoreductase